MPTDSTATLPFYMLSEPHPASQLQPPSTGIALDSIFPLRKADSVTHRRSLFYHSAMPVQSPGLNPRAESAPPAWLFGAIVAVCIVAYIFISTRKIKTKAFFQALIDRHALDRLVRANNLTPMRLTTIGVLLSAILATIGSHAAPLLPGLWGWIATAAIITLAYMLRWGLLRALASVFDDEDAMSVYISSSYLYHLLLCMLLIPLTLLYIYMPWGTEAMLVAIAAVIAASFIARLVRSTKIFLSYSTNLCFFLFYYLCIVEIAPVVALGWWFFAH